VRSSSRRVEHRLLGVDDLVVDDRVDGRRHVVSRDHLLVRQVAVADARVDADHALEARGHETQAGFEASGQLSERELQRHLPLIDLADRCQQVDERDERRGDREDERDPGDVGERVVVHGLLREGAWP
jgi:hypothetical protein